MISVGLDGSVGAMKPLKGYDVTQIRELNGIREQVKWLQYLNPYIMPGRTAATRTRTPYSPTSRFLNEPRKSTPLQLNRARKHRGCNPPTRSWINHRS